MRVSEKRLAEAVRHSLERDLEAARARATALEAERDGLAQQVDKLQGILEMANNTAKRRGEERHGLAALVERLRESSRRVIQTNGSADAMTNLIEAINLNTTAALADYRARVRAEVLEEVAAWALDYPLLYAASTYAPACISIGEVIAAEIRAMKEGK